jgi:osmotically-inducible protein OsmY
MYPGARHQTLAMERALVSCGSTVSVPEGKVRAQVPDGWVTLQGEIEYEYQRHEVERIVRNVKGVVGVTDLIEVKPR